VGEVGEEEAPHGGRVHDVGLRLKPGPEFSKIPGRSL
jgi:hypothetical protein